MEDPCATQIHGDFPGGFVVMESKGTQTPQPKKRRLTEANHAMDRSDRGIDMQQDKGDSGHILSQWGVATPLAALAIGKALGQFGTLMVQEFKIVTCFLWM